MIYSVDAVMALTTAEHCMLCGCYEAVSAEKPLITSNTKVLVEYFKNAIFVDNSPEQIATAIKEAIDNKTQKEELCRLDKKEIQKYWNDRYQWLTKIIQKKITE